MMRQTELMMNNQAAIENLDKIWAQKIDYL